MKLSTNIYRFWFVKYLLVALLVFAVGCKKKKGEATPISFDYTIDTTGIPQDTINFDNPAVRVKNGIYYFQNKAYSGIVFQVLKGYEVQTYTSVLNGKKHGSYRSFYENGQRYEIRRYKNNLSLGKQYGYWEDSGKLKFEYNYYNEKKEGIQKGWYFDGSKSYVYNYKNDKQDGLQRAWRPNQTVYRNFEVKDGIRYGLQSSFTCYEISKLGLKRIN